VHNAAPSGAVSGHLHQDACQSLVSIGVRLPLLTVDNTGRWEIMMYVKRVEDAIVNDKMLQIKISEIERSL
jgi:hypothetical protein